MTAEVAVMNRQAVALAADSAATIQTAHSAKVFSSANKVFALSKHHPVGIMIYGGADFIRTPWEEVVKEYRSKLGKRSFDIIADYAKDFLEFLRTDALIVDQQSEEEYIVQTIGSYFDHIRHDAEASIKEAMEKTGSLKEKEIVELIVKKIEEHHVIWKGGKAVAGASTKKVGDVRTRIQKTADEWLKTFFGNVLLPALAKEKLSEIAAWLFVRTSTLAPTDRSGVVIAGFGDKQMLPSLTSFNIQGRVAGVLHETPYIEAEGRGGRVVAFAQGDVVRSFIEGVNPDFYGELLTLFQRTLLSIPGVVLDKVPHLSGKQKDDITKKATEAIKGEWGSFTHRLREHQKRTLIHPLLEIVSILPKDELATMAETLVNLTSFKRRMSMDTESVGGPIDVALISRGDGLVWVRRKHYFPPELNHHFFANYFGKGTGHANTKKS